MGLLDNRVALVTGASRGIGAAIARALAAHGASVAVNYLHNADRADAVVADIAAAGGKAVAAQGDVSVATDAEQVVRAARALGEIDLLVCNAFGPVHDLRRRAALESRESVEAIQRRVTTQLAATLNCCYLVAPGMRGRGGSIVLIGSNGSRTGGGNGMAEIGVAKAAQDALGYALARELGPDGIRVNTVAPGIVPTDANAGEHRAAWLTAAEQATPLGRVSQPEDIANAVVLLASDLARQITGGYVGVDGGRTFA